MGPKIDSLTHVEKFCTLHIRTRDIWTSGLTVYRERFLHSSNKTMDSVENVRTKFRTLLRLFSLQNCGLCLKSKNSLFSVLDAAVGSSV